MFTRNRCQESFVANDYSSRGARTEQAVPLRGQQVQAQKRTVSPTSLEQNPDSALYRSLMARNVVLFGDMSCG